MLRSLCACSLLVAGCVSTVPPAEERSAIIGGVRDTGDPAIVLLISYPTNMSTFYTCTASLISPTVLVTAAHCVDDANHHNYVFGAYLGDDASAYATAAAIAPSLSPIAAVHAHPSYGPNAPFVADIGVAILQTPLSITPLPIARTSLPASLPGQPARLVGYGQTVYQTYNAAKYATATSVASLPADDTVVVGDVAHHSCVGDSGGPALVQLGGTETIIGVDSYTETTGCTEPAHYRRVDRYLPFLDTYLPAPVDLGVDAAIRQSDASTSQLVDASVGDAAIKDQQTSSGCTLSAGAEASSSALLFGGALFLVATARRRARGRRQAA